jgi:hypothetical protein
MDRLDHLFADFLRERVHLRNVSPRQLTVDLQRPHQSLSI